jgi:hypothetical protein
MDDIIGWLINNIPQPFRGWILTVAQAVKAVIDRILSIMFGVAHAFSYQISFVKGFVDWLGNAGRAVFKFGYWLLTVKLPALLNWAIYQAHALAIQFINDTAAFLRRLIDGAITLAHQLTDWLSGILHEFMDWVHRTVGDIFYALQVLKDIVFPLLTDPDKLAQWLLAAILKAAGRFLLANARPLARVAWRLLMPAAVEAAHILEQIITDLA